jgi:DNA end-binding protein Ku
MAPRANWKGFLKIAEVTCPVALYTAASTSERIAFHTINRATGHRVHRQFVDSETGKPVERDDQVKGYENGSGDYVVLEPEEVSAAVPNSDKTLSVDVFVGCGEIDDVYFDKPYYLTPADQHAEDAFALIRDGLRSQKVAALAQTVLFRRVRTLLIRPHDDGMIATTLNFDYEVRPAKDAFEDVPAIKVKGEMLALAEHIIKTKRGKFDPATFDDRYEAALAELVKAKTEGRKIEPPKTPKRTNVVDLMDALRESAGMIEKRAASKSAAKSHPARKKTAKGKAAHTARRAATYRKAS